MKEPLRVPSAGVRPGLAVAGTLCVLVLTVAVFTLHPITSNDTFWHIACGKELLETGSVPRTDAFTFTSAGRPWVNHEYLAGALFALADGAFGPGGVTLLCAAVILVMVLLLRSAVRTADPSASALFPLLLPIALYGALARLIPRPHIFSLAFAGYLVLLLARLDTPPCL